MAKERHVLKKEIYDEINGVGRGGFESGMWFTSFHENYYNKIQDPDDKSTVCDILANFLKNEDYDASFLSKVAYIYADLEIPGYEAEIKRLSTDKRVEGTLESNWFRMLLDDIKVENELITRMSVLKCESNVTFSRDFFEEAVTFFKKLRGDVSKMYYSKDKNKVKRAEADFLQSYIYGRLVKLLRSERYDANIKTKIALILSDLHFRHADGEIEKLLHDPHIMEASHITLIKQALSLLKES